MTSRLGWIASALAGALAILVNSATVEAAAAAEPGSAEFFETQIRPVLAACCFECHGAKRQESDVRLDSREGMLIGNSDGPVIVPGDAEKSRLVKAVRRKGEIKMPPEKPLPEPAVEALAIWIKAGAPWPEQKVA